MSIKSRIQQIEKRRRTQNDMDPIERFRSGTAHLPQQAASMEEWMQEAKQWQEGQRNE